MWRLIKKSIIGKMKRLSLVDRAKFAEFVLPKGNRRNLIVGKSQDCDVVLPSIPETQTVADRHCTIQTYEDGSAYVSDNGASYFGTYLNNRKLNVGKQRSDGRQLRDSWELRPGDELRLGDYVLNVSIVEEKPLSSGE